ncbi:MAG: peptidase S41, partial [Myxococcota bacterium]
MTLGWLRYPTVHGDRVVFVCEDDLWVAPVDGGLARRLTTGLGACARPRLSPDGRWIAFDGTEEGVREVYVVDADGGAVRRRSWHGDSAQVVGFDPSGRIVFTSGVGQAFARDTLAYAVGVDDGLPEALPYGPVAGGAPGPDAIAVCRHATDLAGWKRYRGGRA